MKQCQLVPKVVIQNQQFEVTDELSPNGGAVTIHPLTMRIFNSYGVYFPSKLKPRKVISYDEFLSNYADYPIKMRVCFDEVPSSATMLLRSKLVTAYGLGLDGCYIIIPANVESGP
jgi:hypothetical protein